MKKLIAESGSTKTEWVLLNNGKEVWRSKTSGLNPHIVDQDEALRVLERSAELRELTEEKLEVFFYGAGCSTAAMCSTIAAYLQQFFTEAKITAESDLLAAARACFHSRRGLIAILGTGTNLAFFDGDNLELRNVSLGYMLGDEMSGNWFGRQLLHDYLYRVLPPELDELMADRLGSDLFAIPDKLYGHPFPNRFLAALAPIALNNQHLNYIKELRERAFRDWRRFHLLPYQDCFHHPLAFVGSVALELREFLRPRL